MFVKLECPRGQQSTKWMILTKIGKRQGQKAIELGVIWKCFIIPGCLFPRSFLLKIYNANYNMHAEYEVSILYSLNDMTEVIIFVPHTKRAWQRTK